MTRADQIPPGFSPMGHIARTLTLAAAVLIVAIVVGSRAPGVAWALVPVFWLFANFFEWAVHRFPMHRPLVPRLMFRNHAGIHHGAFGEDSMAINNARELSLIMMPWYTIVMLLVAASPVAVVAALAGGLPLAGIFYVAAISYFLFYEILHALYHVPPALLQRWGIGGPGSVFARLRAHHGHHHDPRRMSHVNFNVTVPLADTVLRTRRH